MSAPRVRAAARRPALVALALAALLAAAAALAGPLPPAASAEIDALLARLESSGCRFNRNGSWYPAAEAKAHLARKLEWLRDKGLVESAEQFFERAGSGSSVSGQPYLVQCGSDAPVTSGAWLASQLKALRASGGKAAP